jgi:integrase
MQEIRQFKPFTVLRRFSVAAGFYKTCVIDGLLKHSPAEHVRRPPVPPESPTLGLTHLQFEALPTAARESANPSDFALVAKLGLLGLRIFEATGADIADLGEEHGHRVLRVCGKGQQGRPDPAAPSGRAGNRPVHRRPDRRADPSQHPRCATGPPCRHAPPAAAGQDCRGADRPAASANAPPHLRHHHARRRGGTCATSRSPPAHDPAAAQWSAPSRCPAGRDQVPCHGAATSGIR